MLTGNATVSESIESLVNGRLFLWMINGVIASFATWSLSQSAMRLFETPVPPALHLGPSAVAENPEQHLRAVLAASLFGEAQLSPAGTPDTAPLTSLNLVLKGVVAIKDAGMAFVSIQGKAEDLYVVGQEVTAGAVLSAVYPDRVILRRGSQFESLMLDGADDMRGIQIVAANKPIPIQTASSSGKGSTEKPYVVSRVSLRAEVQSPQELLSQAVLVPNAGGGFLLKEIQPDSVIEDFGLRPGDVIRSVNGQALNYADDIRRAYDALRTASQVKVELLRDGKREALHYRVVEEERNAPPRNRRPLRRGNGWVPDDVGPPYLSGNEVSEQPASASF